MRSMLICASVALPFHNRQCSRSTSSTITAFAATRAALSADRPLAVCLRCWSRMPMWNQSRIGSSVMPTSARIRRSPEHPVGEGGQHRVLGSPDGVEALADQDFDICISFGNGSENLPPTHLRFDIADPHLQMPLAILTAANERRVQGHGNGRRRQLRPSHGINPKRRADLQGTSAHSLRILSGINRKHLLQHVSRHSVWHQGGEMRSKLVEFRRRPAMRWPTNASLDRTTPSTAKPGKSHRDLAKMRRDRMVPVVLEVTNATTASALWPLNRVASGLGGNDLLLEARQHPLPVGHGQTQIGDIIEIIRPVDRHDVGKRLVAVSPDLHQPHNPSHASTPGQTKDAKIPLWPRTPKLAAVPQWASISAMTVAQKANRIRERARRALRSSWIAHFRATAAPRLAIKRRAALHGGFT